MAATEKLSRAPASPEKTALLFLPKGEHYDLILLIMNYNLLRNGTKTLYLGTNVSLVNVQNTIAQKQPDLACTYIVRQRKEQLAFIKDLVETASEKLQIHVMMDEPVPLGNTHNVKVMYYAAHDQPDGALIQ